MSLASKASPMECFHMTSRQPYWCPKTMKRRPCWCPKRVLWELNSFLMQTLSFVPINLHILWPRERKHSIRFFNPIIPTQNFMQSHNPKGYLWYSTSHAYFQSQIWPRFFFKILSPELQISKILNPKNLVHPSYIRQAVNLTFSAP